MKSITVFLLAWFLIQPVNVLNFGWASQGRGVPQATPPAVIYSVIMLGR